VFTARYALSLYIKQIRSVFKGLIFHISVILRQLLCDSSLRYFIHMDDYFVPHVNELSLILFLLYFILRNYFFSKMCRHFPCLTLLCDDRNNTATNLTPSVQWFQVLLQDIAVISDAWNLTNDNYCYFNKRIKLRPIFAGASPVNPPPRRGPHTTIS
jgi:hypothetical protein